ncbi:hypothetical protein sos41_42140 [Alphaproteobacteria bacterium SO-S41]|nr:hypothetical protein sos41_42140 [Alphaproteobacteria bacterium SO-S41]
MTQTAPGPKTPTTPPPEVIHVHDHRVACDGGGGALGHPRVFLEIGEDGQATCGYCDRLFVLDGDGH